MRRKESNFKISHWKKLTAITVVFTLIFSLVEPAIASNLYSKRDIQFSRDESYHTLRRASHYMVDDKLASSPQETQIIKLNQSLSRMFSLHIGDRIFGLRRFFSLKDIPYQIKKIQFNAIRFLIQNGWISPFRLFPHLSALHIGTLVELVTMIYENHKNDPSLDERILGEQKAKSFDELFKAVVKASGSVEEGEMIHRMFFPDEQLGELKDKWDVSDIEYYGESNSRILTEFLRNYLRYYVKVDELHIPPEKMTFPQRRVVKVIQQRVNMTGIGSKSLFRFLGLTKIPIRVVDDKYLIDKVKNRGILAFYRDEGRWERLRGGGTYLAFLSEGEIVVGTSLINRWVQLTEEGKGEERDEEIRELVMRELMARALIDYNEQRSDSKVRDAIYKAGHNFGFNGMHGIIDAFPSSKEILRLILSDFQIFISKATGEYVCGLDPESINRDIDWLYKDKETIEGVIQNFPSQERLLSIAREIVGKTITPLILFGITFGLGLSGSAFAFDGNILPKNLIHWEPILLFGGIIGATALSFIGGNSNNLKKFISIKKGEIKLSFLNMFQILKDSSLYYLLAVISGKEPVIRILINGEDPNSIEEAKNLIVKAEEEVMATEDGIKNRIQIVVAGDFKGQDQNNVLAEPTVKGIPSKYVKKIFDRPANGGKIDLEEILHNLKEDEELSKEDYSLWIVGSNLWDISKLIESIASKLFIKNGSEILHLQMIKNKFVGTFQ